MLHYLDHAATTRVCPEAAHAALEGMTGTFGNPSSRHRLGIAAAEALAAARAEVAETISCLPEEVFFTSGGTEGNNWALFGAAELGRHRGKHIITTAVEHASVLEAARKLERMGFSVSYLKPDRKGNISALQVREALRPDTILVSMMLVNNETGAILPVREAAEEVSRAGCPALIHTDAVQGLLKVAFSPKELGVDLLTVSGHKIGAPKGIGALVIRKGLKFPAFLSGGGQEGGLRSGTEPMPSILAFAAACRAGRLNREEAVARMNRLKAYALETLLKEVPGLVVLGEGAAPHILSLSLPGYQSEVLVRFLSDRGICISAASACHRGRKSHVLAAMNRSKPEREGAIRVSIGPDSTEEDIDALREGLKEAQKTLFTVMR